MPDRADLGEVAAEGQADGPVEYRPHLAGGAGDLAQVVGAGEPPAGKPREGAPPDPADRLVAAKVDEGGPARVAVGARLADSELCRQVVRRHLRLADAVLGRGGRPAA